MELINVVMVFIGLVAVFLGVYEFMKRTVVTRNVSASTDAQIREFSKYDAFTCIAEGILVILLAFSDYLPFLKGAAAPSVVTALLLAVVIFNYVMAKKILNNFPSQS